MLNLLRGLVEKEGNTYIYSYCLYGTTKHATTRLSLYNVLFRSNPPPLNPPTAGTLLHQDPVTYSLHLQRKLLELRELIESNTVETANRQQLNMEVKM